MGTPIGRILLMPRGDYSGSAVYNSLDWVRDDGKAWVCKVDNTTGVTPTEGANWTLLAADGNVSGNIEWSAVLHKPFDGVDTTNDFQIDSTGGSDELQIKRGTFGTVRVVSDNSGSPTTTDLEASGDAIIKLKGGTNVTLSADDSADPKEITINSSGGGSGGHQMIPATVDDTDVNTIAAMTYADASLEKVVNAYTIQKYSNVECMSIFTTVAQGNDTVGTWVDDWKSSGASRSGWLWHSALYGILDDDDVEASMVFDVQSEETVSVYAYRVDDNVDKVIDGVTVHGGAIAIKLNSKIQTAGGVKIGLNLKRQRTLVDNFSVIS